MDKLKPLVLVFPFHLYIHDQDLKRTPTWVVVMYVLAPQNGHFAA